MRVLTDMRILDEGAKYIRKDGRWYDLQKREFVDIQEWARCDMRTADFEEMWPAQRDNKRRNCIFCGRNIPKGEDYFKNFPYPYVTIPTWFACEGCFAREMKQVIKSGNYRFLGEDIIKKYGYEGIVNRRGL